VVISHTAYKALFKETITGDEELSGSSVRGSVGTWRKKLCCWRPCARASTSPVLGFI